MLSISVKEVFDSARFYLNDTNGQLFTDSNLTPAFVNAYERLKQKLATNNMAMMDKTSEPILIEAGMTSIGGNGTGPALPVDFISPYQLWENLTNGNLDDYVEMTKVQFLPKIAVRDQYLTWWSYHQQYIHFVGANGNVYVKMDYIADTLLPAKDSADRIDLFFAKLYLSQKTAADAARYIGQNKTRADELDGEALDSLDDVINIDVKQRQSIHTRRRPFMANRRAGWGIR